MISKSNKFIKYASIAAIAIVALAASLSSSNINLGKNILRGSSSDTIHGSITFSMSTGTRVVRNNDYYYTSGSTTTGGVVYLRNASNVSLTNTNYVAKMCGTYDKGSVEPLITFTVADSGTSQFAFQYISSITFAGDNNTRAMTVSKSNDAENWTSAGTVTSGSVNTEVAGAKFIKLSYSNNYNLSITSFTITYYCSASGTPDVPGEKSLTGISVKTAPTTIEYTEGEYFDPTGLVITASYDDLSSEDIAYSSDPSAFSFSPSLSTALTTSDESVTISYGGKSTSCLITVEEDTPGLTGKYTNDYVYGTLTIDFDNLQYSYGSYVTNFTYSISGNSITFTYVAAGSTDSDNSRARLFKVGETTNTGTISGNKITIKTFNGVGTGTNREFSK